MSWNIDANALSSVLLSGFFYDNTNQYSIHSVCVPLQNKKTPKNWRVTGSE